MRSTTFLRADITKEQGASLLRAANAAVSNPDLSPEDHTAALAVIEQIAGDIASIFGPDAADVVEAAFGFAVVPGTNRHV